MCLSCFCAPKKSDQVKRVLKDMLQARQAEESLRLLTMRLRADVDTRKVA